MPALRGRVVKHHVRIYLHESEKTADELKCEVCFNPASDIHHIQRRGMGGSKQADMIENLMALCRKCHNQHGDKKDDKEWLQELHNREMEKWPQEQKEQEEKAKRKNNMSSTAH